jgi:hypothetical protein
MWKMQTEEFSITKWQFIRSFEKKNLSDSLAFQAS